MINAINQATRYIPAWTIYVVGAIGIVWYFWQALNGALGVEPINALERLYGERALQLLILGLAITPLRRWIGVNLIKFRRAIGVTAFAFVFAHLLVWLILDVGILSQIWSDILKRPYITVGMAAFLLLLPLAATSNNWSVRRLGPTWRKLHKITYAAALLGGLHFVMLAKGFQLEPLIYLGVVIVLLLLRLRTIPGISRYSARKAG